MLSPFVIDVSPLSIWEIEIECFDPDPYTEGLEYRAYSEVVIPISTSSIWTYETSLTLGIF